MKKVLIVDDEPHIIRVLRLALSRRGYAVDVARNGAEALKHLESGTYDVVITDIQMPRMNGIELCNVIHEQMPDNKPLTLLLTARPELEYRDLAKDLRKTEFLEKPLSLRWLTKRLDDYFTSGE